MLGRDPRGQARKGLAARDTTVGGVCSNVVTCSKACSNAFLEGVDLEDIGFLLCSNAYIRNKN